MGLRFLRIAVVYLVLGAILGLTHLYPTASGTRLARVHFWLHNLGLPVFMIGLGFVLSGAEAVIPVVVIAAVAVLLGLILFAANVLLNIQPTAEVGR
jgi:hypothetical protein